MVTVYRGTASGQALLDDRGAAGANPSATAAGGAGFGDAAGSRFAQNVDPSVVQDAAAFRVSRGARSARGTWAEFPNRQEKVENDEF